jgi:hypothetical protein
MSLAFSECVINFDLLPPRFRRTRISPCAVNYYSGWLWFVLVFSHYYSCFAATWNHGRELSSNMWLQVRLIRKLLSVYQSTRRQNFVPEDSNLYCHSHEESVLRRYWHFFSTFFLWSINTFRLTFHNLTQTNW